jgi:hypothetical protein
MNFTATEVRALEAEGFKRTGARLQAAHEQAIATMVDALYARVVRTVVTQTTRKLRKRGFKLSLKARGLRCKSRRLARVWLKECERRIAEELDNRLVVRHGPF